MVRLSKIYTKTGDDGTTGLGDGQRVRKDALRVEAYGTTDEANACIGLAVVAGERSGRPDWEPLLQALRSVQHDLFDVGADLCKPIEAGEAAGSALRITPPQTARVEGLIDRFNEGLPSLTSFVLPGGSELAAHLHLARTVTRRAERLCVGLLTIEPTATNPEAVKYLNRLSDLLFVLGRAANIPPAGGGPVDVLWVPGRNRPPG